MNRLVGWTLVPGDTSGKCWRITGVTGSFYSPPTSWTRLIIWVTGSPSWVMDSWSVQALLSSLRTNSESATILAYLSHHRFRVTKSIISSNPSILKQLKSQMFLVKSCISYPLKLLILSNNYLNLLIII